MRKLSIQKITKIIPMLHTREKQALDPSLAPLAQGKAGNRSGAGEDEDENIDVEAMVAKKMENSYALRVGWEPRVPAKDEMSQEDWEFNVPALEKEIKSLTKFGGGRGGAKGGQTSTLHHDLGSVLEGKTLSQMNFNYSDLSISFVRADLRWSKFDGTRLINCLFDYADARCASFQGSELRNCTFVGADLEGADFSGSRLSNCKFVRCNMRGVVAQSSTFAGCEFTLGEMSQMKVTGRTAFNLPMGWSASRRLGWSLTSGTELPRANLRAGVPETAHRSIPPPQEAFTARYKEEEEDQGDEDDEEEFEQSSPRS